MNQWFVIPINPYPWKVPPVSVGRKGGKTYPRFGRDEGLHTYKEAIREFALLQNPTKIDGPVRLRLWFWRNIPKYTTPQGKAARKHESDTTNLQKATEDALQGVLFDNDKDVVDIHSVLMEQGEGAPSFLVICAGPARELRQEFPDFIDEKIDMLANTNYDGRLATLFDELGD